MKWFNRYVRPHPDGGQGLEPIHTASPLLIGWGIHEFLDAWYRSGTKTGVDDGTRDLDHALETTRSVMATRRHEFESEEEWDDVWAMVSKLAVNYHAWYGPDGAEPDYPELKIAFDGDGPLIEREFELDLGFEGFIFTTRIDLVVDGWGYLSGIEHKSTAAGSVGRLFDRMSIGGQVTGQCLALHNAFPDREFRGVIINALVKNRAAKSDRPPFMRHPTGRTDEDLHKFRYDMLHSLVDIRDHLGTYAEHLANGMTVSEAANRTFHAYPNEMECVGFSRCPYYATCKARPYEDGLFEHNYRVRTLPPKTGALELKEF